MSSARIHVPYAPHLPHLPYLPYPPSLDLRRVERLDPLLHVRHELIGDRAVDEPMVVAERQVAHELDGDHVVDDHHALLDRADTEDRDLWLVDDGQAELSAKVSWIGDGERAAVHFLGMELLGARPIGDVGDGARQT